MEHKEANLLNESLGLHSNNNFYGRFVLVEDTVETSATFVLHHIFLTIFSSFHALFFTFVNNCPFHCLANYPTQRTSPQPRHRRFRTLHLHPPLHNISLSLSLSLLKMAKITTQTLTPHPEQQPEPEVPVTDQKELPDPPPQATESETDTKGHQSQDVVASEPSPEPAREPEQPQQPKKIPINLVSFKEESNKLSDLSDSERTSLSTSSAPSILEPLLAADPPPLMDQTATPAFVTRSESRCTPSLHLRVSSKVVISFSWRRVC